MIDVEELKRRIAEEDRPWSPAHFSSDEVAALLDEVERLRKREAEWLAACRRCEQSGCSHKATRVVIAGIPPSGAVLDVHLCDEHAGLSGHDTSFAALIRAAIESEKR